MLLGIFTGLFVFLTCTIAFSIGFKFGKAIKEGREPKFEPTVLLKEVVGINKVEDKETVSWDEGFRNLMAYDGDPINK